jgi:hypothetical protein
LENVILETSYVQLPSRIYDVIIIFLLSAQYAKKNGVMQSKRMVAILVVCIGLMLLLVVSIAYWLVMRKKKGMKNVFHSLFLIMENKYSPTVTWSSAYFEEFPWEFERSTRNSDLPFFDLSIIIAATDNFSVANELGQGGFGLVYKVVYQKDSQNLHNLSSYVC